MVASAGVAGVVVAAVKEHWTVSVTARAESDGEFEVGSASVATVAERGFVVSVSVTGHASVAIAIVDGIPSAAFELE